MKWYEWAALRLRWDVSCLKWYEWAALRLRWDVSCLKWYEWAALRLIVGDLVSFRGPFFVKSNLECLTCSLYVSKPKKLGLKIRATVFGRFWATFRAKNKNTNF